MFMILLLISVSSSVFGGTDLEVTYIERIPKYYSYQGHVLYGGKTFTDDFTPYYATYAYGLSGQDASTKRWPDPGETVTFRVHFRNRGSTMVTGFSYVWKLDGSVVNSGTYPVTMDPGDTGSLSITWNWEFVEHELEFSASVTGDAHPSNNSLMIYTNSLGLYTFIDYSFDSNFQSNTPSYPDAATDSIIEWLQLHCTKLNDMFIDAGSDHRWRYDRLHLVDDHPADLPSYDHANYDGAFPQRYSMEGGYNDPRSGSAYYSSTEDIDYGLLHEIGHQFGIIDIYRLNVSPAQNHVNGMGYSAMPCLWNGCSHFVSEHTALAMSHWHGKRRGYFGQYQFCVPTVNKLLLLDSEGEPLKDANVTIYQRIRTSADGEHIPNIPKFTGTTDQNGIYVIPNVSLSEKSLFWTDIGDDLNDNPFGYIWCIGVNGVFLIKVEKDGAVDYDWIDITEFNIAYWNGNTAEATYVRDTAIGRAMQFAPPEDCAELNAENWDTWAQGSTAEVYDDTSRKIAGAGSVRMETNGGFDTYVRYPKGIIAHWDLTGATHFNVSFYAENPNLGFQNQSPWIRIGNYDGDYMQFQASSDILNQARNQWRSYSIPLTGDATWSRTDVGTPDSTDINYIEIHADTWGYGFKLWVDGVSFTPQPEPLDTDGDGLPDFWELAFFEDLSQGANDDPDNDERTNHEEYVAQTDPTDPNSFLAITALTAVSDGPEPGVHIAWTTVPDKTYQLYYSEGPCSGSMTWLACGDPIEGTGETETFVDSGDVGRVSPLDPSVTERYYKIMPQQ
jgi:hypothetical protein